MRAAAGRDAHDKQAGLLEQNKKLLAMQKELLQQIEERKKLHSALVHSLEDPAKGVKDFNPASHAAPPPPPRTPPPSAAPRQQQQQAPPPPPRAQAAAAAAPRPQPPPSAAAKPVNPVVGSSRPWSSPVRAPTSSQYAQAQAMPPPPPPSAAAAPGPAPAAARPAKPQPRLQESSPAPAARAPHPPPPQVEAPPPPEPQKGPPPAGANVMNLCVVAAECAPWSKTGGLGDVVGALPKALAKRGHRVMVVVPRYGEYLEGWDTSVRKYFNIAGQDVEVGYFHGYIDGVDFVFVDAPMFRHTGANIYGGSTEEVQKRCILLCKAAVEAPWLVPCGGVAYGDANLVFIANDWHTALLPVYLQAYYRDNGLMEYARSILVIHNMAHQGRGPVADYGRLGLPGHYLDKFRLFDPVGGEHMNIFMAGLICAHRLVAVSHGYAWECQTAEGGWGLDGVLRDHAWKLRGVVNGIDTGEWSPEHDVHLRDDGYSNYGSGNLQQKLACKAALQRELGLPVRADVPLVGFIGRLDYQKGVDIIESALPWMMDQDMQLVMLGSGRGDLEDMLRGFEHHHRDKCRAWVGFSVRMAHRITAGVDIQLMPSRFEPCGLNQLYAMRYGTVPVVHAVGGLRDTVHQFDPFNNVGLGWTFDAANADALIHALGNAIYTFRDFKDSWRSLQLRGMSQDLSWDNAAQQYEEVLLAAKYTW